MTQTPSGAAKIAAARTGCNSAEEWLAKRASGLKWCSGHRAWLPENQFGTDVYRRDRKSVICRACTNKRRAAALTRPIAPCGTSL